MKYILRTPLIILCFIIVIVLGFYIGYGISEDFLMLYSSKLTQLPVRYLLIAIILSSSSLVFKEQNGLAICMRKKNFFNAILNNIKYEVYILLLIFSTFEIPIMLQNFSLFFQNFYFMLMMYLNDIIISLFILSIVKSIDIFIKNRTTSCAIFLVILSIIDILLEHGNYFFFENIYFDMSYIFCLPYIYKNYVVLAIILIIITIFLNLLSIFLRIKKDFMLNDVHEEN